MPADDYDLLGQGRQTRGHDKTSTQETPPKGLLDYIEEDDEAARDNEFTSSISRGGRLDQTQQVHKMKNKSFNTTHAMLPIFNSRSSHHSNGAKLVGTAKGSALTRLNS